MNSLLVGNTANVDQMFRGIIKISWQAVKLKIQKTCKAHSRHMNRGKIKEMISLRCKYRP